MPEENIKQRLTDFLVNNVVSRAQLDEALQQQRTAGGSLSQILVEKGFTSEKELMAGLSAYLGLPPIDLSKIKIKEDVVELIPKNIALFYLAVPISHVGNILTVAMADPLNVLAIDDLKVVTGLDIQPVISNKKDVQAAIDNYYAPSSDIQDIVNKIAIAEISLPDEDEEVDTAEIIDQTDKPPVIRIVNLILYQGIKSKASDIHLEPFENKLRLRYRIDGVLYENPPPPKHMHAAITSRIKILSRLDITERRRPQDGRFRIRVEKKEVDFRVSILPTSYGEKVVLRILDKGALCMQLDKLGLSGKSLKAFDTAINNPYGMILLTGPTGSGKTTTLYSALSTINSEDVNIVTVEDPVEYQFVGINQVAVHPDIGLTFASGLRSILRQDPDIIMVGEIRDLETADIAIKSALTGHLVFSTLHTNDAAGAVTRLIDMGIEPFLVSSSLLLVVAQRLVRRICKHCKEKSEVSASIIERLGYTAEKGKVPTFWHGTGCRNCRDTGYSGRVALYEVLEVNKEIQDLMIERATSEDIKKVAMTNGMRTLRMAGIACAKEGLTTLEEILRVTAKD